MRGASRWVLASSKLSVSTWRTYSGANRISEQYTARRPRALPARAPPGGRHAEVASARHPARRCRAGPYARVGAGAGARAGHARRRWRCRACSQPVEVIRDRWGINHIYAQNEDDLFQAQGYLAAKDRLFQFEVWRRRATGTVAEILGPRELTRDIGTRLHKFRGDLDAELNHYHPRGKAIVEAYVRGINAYVDEAMRSPATLPIEFRMLGITPGKWTPEVVISRHQALTSNVPNEATNMRALGALGARQAARSAVAAGRRARRSRSIPLIDAKTFPADVLAVYNAFRDTIDFQPEDVAPAYRGQARAAAAAGQPPLALARSASMAAGSSTPTSARTTGW